MAASEEQQNQAEATTASLLEWLRTQDLTNPMIVLSAFITVIRVIIENELEEHEHLRVTTRVASIMLHYALDDDRSDILTSGPPH